MQESEALCLYVCMYVALWTIMDKPKIDPWLIFLDFQKKILQFFWQIDIDSDKIKRTIFTPI